MPRSNHASGSKVCDEEVVPQGALKKKRQLLTALPNCWRSWVHQIGMVVLVTDGVALLGFLLALPRMGGGVATTAVGEYGREVVLD
jgi:hypothetical protein